MSKDIPENISYASAADNTDGAAQAGDLLYSFMTAPTSKLDADQYMVSDLDGVTEGLFGSGNMNFLMMQSAQTNEAISNLNPLDDTLSSDGLAISPLAGTSGPLPGSFNKTGDGDSYNPMTSVFGPYDNTGTGIGDGGTGPGSFGATTLAGNVSSQNPFLSAQNFATSTSDITTGIDGNNGIGLNGQSGPAGTPGLSGNDGTNGTNGNNGTNGGDGNNGLNGLDGITEILDLGPIGLDLSLDLSNITNLTLDVFNGDNILNVINETLNLGPVLDPVTDLVGNLASGIDLGLLLDPFQYDDSPDDQDLVLTSEIDLLGIPLPDIGFHLPLDPVELLLGDIDLNLDITNDLVDGILGGSDAGNLIDGLTGGILEDLIGNDAGELLGGLLGGAAENDHDAGLDANVNLLGTNLVDLPLDLVVNPVEDLLGDLDIGAGLGLDLLGSQETNNAAGDTDIVIPLDLNLVDNNLLGDSLNISLDPVEEIVGDIDLDLTVAGDVLGQTADSLIDGFAGGTGDDTLLSQVGDLVGNLAGDLLPSAGDSDLDSTINLDLLDALPITNDLDLNLDAAENLVGDINILSEIDDDLDLADALMVDLVPAMPDAGIIEDILAPIDQALNDASDLISALPETLGSLGDITDSLLSGDGEFLSWTESILPESGDLLGGGITDDIGSVLSDPLGGASLLSTPVLPVLSAPLGGGGNHFGGLFG